MPRQRYRQGVSPLPLVPFTPNPLPAADAGIPPALEPNPNPIPVTTAVPITTAPLTSAAPAPLVAPTFPTLSFQKALQTRMAELQIMNAFQLAKRCGQHPRNATASRILQGKVKNPYLDTLLTYVNGTGGKVLLHWPQSATPFIQLVQE